MSSNDPPLALWFEEPRLATLKTAEAPAPGDGEVRIEASASAVSHGTEMLVYRGEVPEGIGLDLPTLEGSFGFPIKYGYATTGTITETGNDIEYLAPGDLVFVHHPHQEAFTVPVTMPIKLPYGTSPEHGVFFANLETALNIVLDTPTRLGETVVVFGQGVVGLLVTRLLAMSGVRVIAVDPVENRRDIALEFGADVAISPHEDIPVSDVAVEVSGSQTALAAAIGCVADEGTVVVASWYGTKSVLLDLGGRFHRGRVRMKSSQVGRIAPELSPRWNHDRRTRAALELMPRIDLATLITHRIPFREAPSAYRMLDAGAEDAVQVVFEYGSRQSTGR